MKQIIRLTESDLHRIVKESVSKILTEMDYVSPGMAGNTMTAGGHFGRSNVANKEDVLETYIQKLVDNGLPENITDAVIEKCNENPELFEIGFNVDSTYDETTGYGTQDSPVMTATPTNGYKELKQFIGNMANDPQITQVLLTSLDEAIQEISDKLTGNTY